MKRGMIRLLAVVLVALLGAACSVTRYIPEDAYLLHKVHIETDRETPRRERIPKEEFAKFIRQTPNKRVLGVNFYVWLYEQADSSKHNGWNNWKRRIGEEAVLLDENYTTRSAQNLKIFMDSKGFFRSTSAFEIDTTRRRRATVTYRVQQREPYHIRSLDYEFRDRNLEPIILADTVNTLLKVGERFDITMLDAERERIAVYLKDLGYYNFTVGNIEYVADTLRSDRTVDVKMVVKQHLTGYDDRGEPQLEDNLAYRIGELHILPAYDPNVLPNTTTSLEGLDLKLDTTAYRGLDIVYDNRMPLRRSVLRRAVLLEKGQLYSTSEVERTYAELTSLGYFRSAKISFRELPQRVEHADTIRVDDFDGEQTIVQRSTEGLLACDILCTPTLKQSATIELEGSTTSSFYGLKATVGYQNRNIFRGAEALDISFTGGYEFMKAKDAAMRRATEVGVTAGLTFPRFLLPVDNYFRSAVQPKTKIEASVNFQDRPYYRRTLTSMSLGYQWANRRYSTFSLRPIDINVIHVSRLDSTFLASTQNKYLINSYKTQLIAGLSFGYTYNNQRRNLGGNATLFRLNFESAGNLVDGLERLFGEKRADRDYYTLFGIRYSQYVRADVSLSRKIVLGEKTAFAGRIYAGAARAYSNSDAVPFDRLFYAGGSNSMRGWAARTLGPGSVPDPDSAFPTQLGDMKLEANLEFRFPIWGIVHGATFFDLGNIWYMQSNPSEYSDDAVFHIDNFYKQLGFNTGLGIRLDIKFAVLRLDWGIQLHNPNQPAGERWIHNLRWKNTALNFGVGYPF